MTFAEQHDPGDPVSMPGDSARPARRHFSFSPSRISVAARAGFPPARLRIWCLGALASGCLLACVSAGPSAAVSPKVATAGGGFQSAGPSITIVSPRRRALYGLMSRVVARFRCSEGGTTAAISTCRGTVPNGHTIYTGTRGSKTFTVAATDTAGNRVTKTVHYKVLPYTNPLRAVRGLQRGRIDQGVDYAGSGPILAIGRGKVIRGRNHDLGWPGGGWLLYKLLQGPFAGKYVYVAENVTVRVRAGQTVTTGEKIATLHDAYPNMETGWASDFRDTTLANEDGHLCPCGDAGGWSTIEGRNFNHLLWVLGAPTGILQPNPPTQTMPLGWPKLRSNRTVRAVPESRTPLPEGWTARSP